MEIIPFVDFKAFEVYFFSGEEITLKVGTEFRHRAGRTKRHFFPFQQVRETHHFVFFLFFNLLLTSPNIFFCPPPSTSPPRAK